MTDDLSLMTLKGLGSAGKIGRNVFRASNLILPYNIHIHYSSVNKQKYEHLKRYTFVRVSKTTESL
jgi:hypothetical protein